MQGHRLGSVALALIGSNHDNGHVVCLQWPSGNNWPGISSQFATRNPGFAMQFCNRVTESCVKHMIRAIAIMQLLS